MIHIFDIHVLYNLNLTMIRSFESQVLSVGSIPIVEYRDNKEHDITLSFRQDTLYIQVYKIKPIG